MRASQELRWRQSIKENEERRRRYQEARRRIDEEEKTQAHRALEIRRHERARMDELMRHPTQPPAPAKRPILRKGGRTHSAAKECGSAVISACDRLEHDKQRREWSEGLKQYIARQRQAAKGAADKDTSQTDALSWQELKTAAEAGFEELLRHQEAAATAEQQQYGQRNWSRPGMTRSRGGTSVLTLPPACLRPAQPTGCAHDAAASISTSYTSKWADRIQQMLSRTLGEPAAVAHSEEDKPASTRHNTSKQVTYVSQQQQNDLESAPNVGLREACVTVSSIEFRGQRLAATADGHQGLHSALPVKKQHGPADSPPALAASQGQHCNNSPTGAVSNSSPQQTCELGASAAARVAADDDVQQHLPAAAQAAADALRASMEKLHRATKVMRCPPQSSALTGKDWCAAANRGQSSSRPDISVRQQWQNLQQSLEEQHRTPLLPQLHKQEEQAATWFTCDACSSASGIEESCGTSTAESVHTQSPATCSLTTTRSSAAGDSPVGIGWCTLHVLQPPSATGLHSEQAALQSLPMPSRQEPDVGKAAGVTAPVMPAAHSTIQLPAEHQSLYQPKQTQQSEATASSAHDKSQQYSEPRSGTQSELHVEALATLSAGHQQGKAADAADTGDSTASTEGVPADNSCQRVAPSNQNPCRPDTGGNGDGPTLDSLLVEVHQLAELRKALKAELAAMGHDHIAAAMRSLCWTAKPSPITAVSEGHMQGEQEGGQQQQQQQHCSAGLQPITPGAVAAVPDEHCATETTAFTECSSTCRHQELQQHVQKQPHKGAEPARDITAVAAGTPLSNAGTPTGSTAYRVPGGQHAGAGSGVAGIPEPTLLSVDKQIRPSTEMDMSLSFGKPVASHYVESALPQVQLSSSVRLQPHPNSALQKLTRQLLMPTNSHQRIEAQLEAQAQQPRQQQQQAQAFQPANDAQAAAAVEVPAVPPVPSWSPLGVTPTEAAAAEHCVGWQGPQTLQQLLTVPAACSTPPPAIGLPNTMASAPSAHPALRAPGAASEPQGYYDMGHVRSRQQATVPQVIIVNADNKWRLSPVLQAPDAVMELASCSPGTHVSPNGRGTNGSIPTGSVSNGNDGSGFLAKVSTQASMANGNRPSTTAQVTSPSTTGTAARHLLHQGSYLTAAVTAKQKLQKDKVERQRLEAATSAVAGAETRPGPHTGAHSPPPAMMTAAHDWGPAHISGSAQHNKSFSQRWEDSRPQQQQVVQASCVRLQQRHPTLQHPEKQMTDNNTSYMNSSLARSQPSLSASRPPSPTRRAGVEVKGQQQPPCSRTLVAPPAPPRLAAAAPGGCSTPVSQQVSPAMTPPASRIPSAPSTPATSRPRSGDSLGTAHMQWCHHQARRQDSNTPPVASFDSDCDHLERELSSKQTPWLQSSTKAAVSRGQSSMMQPRNNQQAQAQPPVVPLQQCNSTNTDAGCATQQKNMWTVVQAAAKAAGAVAKLDAVSGTAPARINAALQLGLRNPAAELNPAAGQGTPLKVAQRARQPMVATAAAAAYSSPGHRQFGAKTSAVGTTVGVEAGIVTMPDSYTKHGSRAADAGLKPGQGTSDQLTSSQQLSLEEAELIRSLQRLNIRQAQRQQLSAHRVVPAAAVEAMPLAAPSTRTASPMRGLSAPSATTATRKSAPAAKVVLSHSGKGKGQREGKLVAVRTPTGAPCATAAIAPAAQQAAVCCTDATSAVPVGSRAWLDQWPVDVGGHMHPAALSRPLQLPMMQHGCSFIPAFGVPCAAWQEHLLPGSPCTMRGLGRHAAAAIAAAAPAHMQQPLRSIVPAFNPQVSSYWQHPVQPGAVSQQYWAASQQMHYQHWQQQQQQPGIACPATAGTLSVGCFSNSGSVVLQPPNSAPTGGTHAPGSPLLPTLHYQQTVMRNRTSNSGDRMSDADSYGSIVAGGRPQQEDKRAGEPNIWPSRQLDKITGVVGMGRMDDQQESGSIRVYKPGLLL